MRRNSRWAAAPALLFAGLVVGAWTAAAKPVAKSQTTATTQPNAATTTPYVAVKGNHLVNGAGQVIRLLGVDRSGAEYECLGGSQIFDGPATKWSVADIASWHVNAVRVPLNEDCWLGINGVKARVSGAAYHTAIENYVNVLQSFGIIVILDLHWAAPGPDLADRQWP